MSLLRIDVTEGRPAVVGALLCAAFGVSLFFHGAGTNFVLLWVVAALLLSALSIGRAQGVLDTVAEHPLPAAVALAALAYLVLAYQWSLSKEVSYPATWVLASTPLAFLAARRLATGSASLRGLEITLFGIVLVLAVANAIRFFASGERSQWPLADPNNYGAVTYAIWIVFAYRLLVARWSGPNTSSPWIFAQYAVSLVLLIAIFATRSRVCVLIVVAATVLWFVVALLRRVSMRPVLEVAATGIVAFVLVALADAVVVAKLSDSRILGDGLLVRMELLRAAFQMVADYPLTGTGMFGFSLLYPAYRSPVEQDTKGLFVHNDYVQLLLEGGPVLAALLLTWLVPVFVRFARGLSRAQSSQEDDFGYSMAVLALAAHAVVTFVLYTLPLAILLGLLSARLSTRPIQRRGNVEPALRMSVVGAIAFGWIAWIYLALDVAIFGAFQGQQVPGIAWVRADEQRQLDFARAAQRVNSNRSMPILAEAVILRGRLEAEPESEYLRTRTGDRLHAAIAADPRNPIGYLELAAYLDALPGERSPLGTPDELRLSTIALEPTFTPGIDATIAQYQRQGDGDAIYRLLKNVVFPWLPLIERRHSGASVPYLKGLEALAQKRDDRECLDAIVSMKQRLATITASSPVVPGQPAEVSSRPMNR